MNEQRISDKVATSFLMGNAADTEGLGQLSRRAKVFDTKEELAEYLKSHPKADKSKHSVGGGGGKPKGKKNDPKKLLKQQDEDDAEKTDREDAENQALSEKKQKAEGKKAPAKDDGDAGASTDSPERSAQKQQVRGIMKEIMDAGTEGDGGIDKAYDMLYENVANDPELLMEGHTAIVLHEIQSVIDQAGAEGGQEVLDSISGEGAITDGIIAEAQALIDAAGGADDAGGTPSAGAGGSDGPAKPHGKKSVSDKSMAKVNNVMSTHSLTTESDEVKELADFKSTLGQRVPEKDVGQWYVRNVQTLKSDFIKNMSAGNYKDPAAFKAAQERMKKMPAGDFAKILAAITDEEGE